ncbi:ImmA/IrrE family metallo-endopeptidase [Mariniluteicoccus flavus]
MRQHDEGQNGIHLVAGTDSQRTSYDPWEDAAERGLTVHETPLPDGTVGLTDLEANVWIDSRLHQSEARATLAHELAHFDLNDRAPGRSGGGMRGPVAGSVERECDRIAAERLIPFDALLNAAAWADSVEELADELGVDPGTVLARIGALDADDARRFERQAGRLHYAPRRRALTRRTPMRKVKKP